MGGKPQIMNARKMSGIFKRPRFPLGVSQARASALAPNISPLSLTQSPHSFLSFFIQTSVKDRGPSSLPLSLPPFSLPP